MASKDSIVSRKQFDRGMKLLTTMGRQNTMIKELKEPFPDLYDITVGFLFGDVWTRPHLSLRERELITIAANMSLMRPTGNISHWRSAQHIGISKEALLEVILHVGLYAGWGAITPALTQLRNVLEEDAAAKKDQGGSRRAAAKSAKAPVRKSGKAARR